MWGRRFRLPCVPEQVIISQSRQRVGALKIGSSTLLTALSVSTAAKNPASAEGRKTGAQHSQARRLWCAGVCHTEFQVVHNRGPAIGSLREHSLSDSAGIEVSEKDRVRTY